MYWDYVDEELLNKEKEETKLKIYVSDNHYGNEILLNVKEENHLDYFQGYKIKYFDLSN